MAKQHIIDCPHCGNRTGATILYHHVGCEELYDNNGEFVDTVKVFYFLTECMTCSKICLFSNWEFHEDPQNLLEAHLEYPTARKFSTDVPEEIRRTYEQAKKVIKISPDAFAVLIRKALEYLGQCHGIKEYNLKRMLDKLAKKEIIPGHLAQMTEAIRLVGNIGAHASSVSIGKEEAGLIDDFFVAIIEYVYIAPAKIKKLKEKLSRFST